MMKFLTEISIIFIINFLPTFNSIEYVDKCPDIQPVKGYKISTETWYILKVYGLSVNSSDAKCMRLFLTFDGATSNLVVNGTLTSGVDIYKTSTIGQRKGDANATFTKKIRVSGKGQDFNLPVEIHVKSFIFFFIKSFY